MNRRMYDVEALLTAATARWRLLRFLRQSATLATLVTGLTLLLGIGMAGGYLTNPSWMTACFAILTLATFAVWLVIGLAAAIVVEDRGALAAALERGHRPLMDRLNTVIFLQERRDPRLDAYADRIEQQTRDLVQRDPPPLPFAPRLALARGALLLALLLVTILFYGRFHPWQQMVTAARRATDAAEMAEMANTSLEIPAWDEPSEPAAEALPWGEVRISRPGTDVRATVLDVIPLTIEAVADQRLVRIEWFTAVNQQDATQHELPPPDDPNSGLYQLELPLPDDKVEPWDVVSYFAQATTEDGRTYRSDTYFVEVVPFREELERVPGGPQGPGYAMLDQLTALIERQEEIIRHTDRSAQSTGPPEDQRQATLESLARAEAELGRALQHVAAVASSRLNQPLATELDQRFDRVAAAVNQAEDALRKAALPEATRQERGALKELIAARKQFQNIFRDDPGAVAQATGKTTATRQPKTPPQGADERSSQAESAAPPELQSQRTAAAQQQLESARKFVQNTLLAERNLERAAKPPRAANPPRAASPPRAANSPLAASPPRSVQFQQLAERQRVLNRSLKDFVTDHPQSFARCQNAAAGAQGSMARAAESLAAGSHRARQDAGAAADALQQLDDALEKRLQQNQLATAHELRKALDTQISKLGACQQQGASPGQCRQLAGQATSVAGQLRQITQQEPTRQQFGPQLGTALSDANQRRLDAQAQRLAEAPDRAARKQAAGQLGQQLQRIARAFDASCPNGLGQTLPNGPLQARGQAAIARGLRPLESVARSQTGKRPLSRQDRAQLVREAMANLQAGVTDLYGSNQNSQQVIDSLQQRLKQPNTPVDMRTVRQLRSALEQLSAELAAAKDPPTDRVDTTHIDLDRLPAAYRQSIEKYFERLSADQ